MRAKAKVNRNPSQPTRWPVDIGVRRKLKAPDQVSLECHHDARKIGERRCVGRAGHVVQSLLKWTVNQWPEARQGTRAKTRFGSCGGMPRLSLTSVKAQEHDRGMMREMGYQQEEFFVGLDALGLRTAARHPRLPMAWTSRASHDIRLKRRSK